MCMRADIKHRIDLNIQTENVDGAITGYFVITVLSCDNQLKALYLHLHVFLFYTSHNQLNIICNIAYHYGMVYCCLFLFTICNQIFKLKTFHVYQGRVLLYKILTKSKRVNFT